MHTSISYDLNIWFEIRYMQGYVCMLPGIALHWERYHVDLIIIITVIINNNIIVLIIIIIIIIVIISTRL